MATTNEPADLILNEIHQTRLALIKQHGGVAGLAAFLRAEEANTDREVANSALPNGQNKLPPPIPRSRSLPSGNSGPRS